MLPKQVDGASDSIARILAVDDEPHVRGLLSRWLSSAAYNCDCAANAAEAWSFLQSQAVDLVTTDIRMPGESGLELMQRIKKGFPDTAVLMLTGCEDTRLAIESLSQGASGYLLKPTSRDEFLREVEKALKRRALEIERHRFAREIEARVRDQSRVIRSAQQETVHRLIAASMMRDGETGSHIARVGQMSALVAKAAGWLPDAVELIRFAAPMHDIGKVGIPDAILRKPGILTPTECEVMKTHSLIGSQILSGSSSTMLQMAEQIARWHHEWWDGTGYPDGLAGTAIPEAARIVAVVDFYDALTHDRVYRAAFQEGAALKLLKRGSGTQFDPDVVRYFFESLAAIRAFSAEESGSTGALASIVLAPAGSLTESASCREWIAAATALD